MRARDWLFAPWLLLFALAAGVCVLWVYARGQALRRLDQAPALAAAHGLALTLGPRSVSGFPFRLRIRVAPVRVESGSGWAVQAPELIAQAYVFAPRKWVAVAPSGVTVRRPQGGAFDLKGEALRASISRLGLSNWLAVAQADGARLVPAPGAHSVSLQSARKIEVDAKASSQPGETAVLLQVDGGVATPESAVWHVASGSPFDLALSGRLSQGAFALDRLAAQAGPVSLSSAGGALQAGPDGRLEGAIPLTVRHAPHAPPAKPGTPAAVAIARADAAGETATLPLVFENGQARLGPFKLGASPRIAP